MCIVKAGDVWWICAFGLNRLGRFRLSGFRLSGFRLNGFRLNRFRRSGFGLNPFRRDRFSFNRFGRAVLLLLSRPVPAESVHPARFFGVRGAPEEALRSLRSGSMSGNACGNKETERQPQPQCPARPGVWPLSGARSGLSLPLGAFRKCLIFFQGLDQFAGRGLPLLVIQLDRLTPHQRLKILGSSSCRGMGALSTSTGTTRISRASAVLVSSRMKSWGSSRRRRPEASSALSHWLPIRTISTLHEATALRWPLRSRFPALFPQHP